MPGAIAEKTRRRLRRYSATWKEKRLQQGKAQQGTAYCRKAVHHRNLTCLKSHINQTIGCYEFAARCVAPYGQELA